MTHRPPATRTLKVDALARVEGEGAMHVEVRDGRLHDVQLRIYEPPRFFEAFLRGRRYTEPADITAGANVLLQIVLATAGVAA